MRRFSEKHQRAVAPAKDMNAAAEAIVKLRNNVWQSKLGPTELLAEELRIREKHCLLEDTPLHDVTRRGQPTVVTSARAPLNLLVSGKCRGGARHDRHGITAATIWLKPGITSTIT
jgi:hypothetical protein